MNVSLQVRKALLLVVMGGIEFVSRVIWLVELADASVGKGKK